MSATAAAQTPLEEVVVVSARTPQALADHAGNAAVIGGAAIDAAAAKHIHELMVRIPGVWISRGSGQESLPSVRSPVLTGAGSCGAFLTLEDGVPTRPSGFCNVNQLFELPTELADNIEVIRGPGSALYGSNALHGLINVRLPDPRADAGHHVGLELGANAFRRLVVATHIDSEAPTTLGLVATDDGGFRDDSGFRQYKGHAAKAWSTGSSEWSARFSFSDLDQETAGFLFGEDVYRDRARNRQNLNPEAFRQADSQRLTLHWRRSGRLFDYDVRPYLRRSRMAFLQHFLPGQPLEENGHTSAGVLANMSRTTDLGRVSFGIDADIADAFLRETQDGPTEGSPFLVATRPQGKHYDYDVDALTGAAYVQGEYRAAPALTLMAGLRAEFVRYDYTNNMLDGNTRDDGTECGFGGCLYTRPTDRRDRFFDVAPKLAALWRVGDAASLYANLSRGFRAPQMTELYRLQSGQQVSDLDLETLDSLELGVRARGARWRIDSSAFAMRKRDSVFRDAEGFNVSGARSRHEGLEFVADYDFGGGVSASVNGTFARHLYDFDQVAARGETFISGRDVDTAPRWQGSAQVTYQRPRGVNATVQIVSLGSYYLDAENQREYPGHTITNLRVGLPLGERWHVTARLNNLFDRGIADRADFAFGNFRYLPGRGRELFVQFTYHVRGADQSSSAGTASAALTD